MIDTVTIEEQRGTKPITRARVDRATACYYPDSQRVVLVADKADFGAALRALTELRDHYGASTEPDPCTCKNGPTRWGRGDQQADTCATCGGYCPP
ncbi:hypothetical protein SEA_RAWRGERTHAT_66 [Mycobacterium phage RawrgerThat]|nr:hypothetical protein SEA_RAWRGERTHAT_66 [Mycobacterium phage RawrgerThat]